MTVSTTRSICSQISKSKRPKRCSNHTFVLRPKIKNLYFKEKLVVSFCPLGDPQNSKESESILPVLNKDRSSELPNFILEKDFQKIKSQLSKYKQEHLYKKVDQTPKSTIFNPKPHSKSLYCSVCKAHYQDYLNHVAEPRHVKALRENKFEFEIKRLTKIVHARHLRRLQQPKLVEESTL